MKQQIFLTTPEEVMEYDLDGNIVSTKSLKSTCFYSFDLYSMRNILYFKQTKHKFQAEITALAEGYGLTLAGFNNGDLYDFESQRTMNFGSKIRKIQLYGDRVCVSTSNELIILNRDMDVIKKLNVINSDFQLRSYTYVLDLNCLRVYDEKFNELTKIIGRFQCLQVNLMEDTMFFSTNTKLIKKSVYGGSVKELPLDDQLEGLSFSVDERYLIAWSSKVAMLIDTENFVILKELFNGTVSSAHAGLVGTLFNGEDLTKFSRVSRPLSHLNSLMNFKPSFDEQKKNEQLKSYTSELKKLNDMLYHELLQS
jgi:hypothetical protein